jgi:hypothetical protein
MDNIVERARRRLDAAYQTGRYERELCLRDRRFYSIPGAMWEDAAWSDQFANVPKLEINKALGAVDAVLSEYRQNGVTVNFRCGDDEALEENCEALNGCFRADERRSGAEEAYDIAREESAAGGFGAWRFRTEYEDDGDPDNDYQVANIEVVTDADQRVWFDPGARRADKRDAKWCIVINPMTKEDFEEKYPGASPFMPPTIKTSFEWFTPDVCNVAEYFEVEEVSVEYRYFENIATEEEKKFQADRLDDDALGQMLATGWRETKTRKIKTRRVVKYLLTGADIVGKREILAGKYIPIIPVYGKRRVVEGIERFEGKVRVMVDPMRLYNAQVSVLAEQAALAQHERPILTSDQVAGHEQSWADGNINRAPYQLINPFFDENGNAIPSGPVGVVSAPQVSPSLSALIQIASNDIRELIGQDLEDEGLPSNTSGDALEMIYSKRDMKYELYHDNWSKAMAWAGEVWLSIFQDIYVETGRTLPVVDPQDEDGVVTIGETRMTQSGKQFDMLDLSKGKYGVLVDIGPSSQSKRDKTVRMLLNAAPMVAGDPELQNAMMATAMLNVEGEGIGDLQDWLRKRLLRSGMVKPNEQEQAELEKENEQQQPDPNTTLALAAADQATAEAQKARALSVKALADAERAKADAAKIIAETEGEDQRQLLEALSAV